MKFFRFKAQPDENGYVTAATADAILPGQMTIVTLGGRSVILTRWQGDVVAFSSVCPHAAADLSRGELYKGKIECPDHGYCFDIRSGRVLWPEDEVCRLKRYPTREEGGQIKVKVT